MKKCSNFFSLFNENNPKIMFFVKKVNFLTLVHSKSFREVIFIRSLCHIVSVRLQILSGLRMIWKTCQAKPRKLFVYLICHVFLRFSLYGILSSLTFSVTTVRMRPMDKIEESGDSLSGMHLAAIGTNTGVIHLVDVFKGKVIKSLQIHSFPVK